MSSTSIPTGGPGAAPSTTKAPLIQVGDDVFVCLDTMIHRPMKVTAVTHLTLKVEGRDVTSVRASGVVFCEPEDHSTHAIRTLGSGTKDPARFHGRPERLNPFVYGELLSEGTGYGQWRRR